MKWEIEFEYEHCVSRFALLRTSCQMKKTSHYSKRRKIMIKKEKSWKWTRKYVCNDNVQNFDIFFSTENFLCPCGKINCWQETPIIALFRNVSWFIFLFKVGFRVTLFSSYTISSCLWNLRKRGIEKWKRSYIIVTHMVDLKWLYCFPIYNNSSIENGFRIMPTYYVLFGS